MVKQSVFLMHKIPASERFGTPQILAGVLLLVFVAQCAWLVAHEHPGILSQDELVRIEQGLGQWRGHGIAGTPSIKLALRDPDQSYDDLYDRYHSPLSYLIATAPVAVFRPSPDSPLWPWLTRVPYVFFGVMLGASLWYVSRRLYGNPGGFVALALYCFSPAVIRSSALWVSPPNTGAAWGTFGAVFTAIAVSHTLYAPREVVLWNWRRTLLLGISLALAIGSQFSLAIIVPVLLAFMLYLAPDRRLPAVTILGAACVVGILIMFSSYFFHPAAFIESLRHARWLEANWRSAFMSGAYLQLARELAESGPVLLLLFPAALTTYAGWRRARYFGNTAPLLVATLFLALRILAPHDTGAIFGLAAAVFLFVFVAGIAADLLETSYRDLVFAVFAGLIAANAMWNLAGLLKIARP